MEPRHLERLRALVHDCVAKHMYASAVFFADKVLALSGDCAQDVFLLAQVW